MTSLCMVCGTSRIFICKEHQQMGWQPNSAESFCMGAPPTSRARLVRGNVTFLIIPEDYIIRPGEKGNITRWVGDRCDRRPTRKELKQIGVPDGAKYAEDIRDV